MQGAAAWQGQEKKYTAAQRAPAQEAAAADASPPRESSGELAAAGPGRATARPPPPRPQPKLTAAREHGYAAGVHVTLLQAWTCETRLFSDIRWLLTIFFPTHAELAAAAAAQRARAAHSQLVAAATVDDGPLSIGGWVPPSIPVATAPANGDTAEGADADDAAATADEPPPQQAAAAGSGHDVNGAAASSGSGSESGDSDDDCDSESGGGGTGGDQDRPQSFF